MTTGRKPNLAGIQRFGAAAYVKLKNAGKLDKQASKGHFVGYDSKSKDTEFTGLKNVLYPSNAM